ncbi:MAG: hypothetical protein ACJA06_000884 [Halocynthiibacter sp.]|jgi:lipid A 3-O-deacylase
MDGTLAMIFLAASLSDMTLSYCKDGCVRQQDAAAHLNFSLARVQYQEEFTSNEIYVSYELGTKYGPFQPTIAASATDRGSIWIGVGATWERSIGDFFVTSTLMPGLYSAGSGHNLGSVLEFRSILGAGYEFKNGGRIAVTYDHRSNGDIVNWNPGLETVAVRYSIAFR